MKQPPLIEYNLKERGRKFTGQERNFNIQAICDSINSPATQEKVKSRGMLGYFGHKMRLLAGLEPTESVVISGKINEVEPAIVTTYLEAFPDGTIKHQTEFLDTASGKKAARMFASKVGGFSSAIDERRPEFHGFDWVYSPNFNHNRGFSLDSTAEGLTFDSVMAEIKEEEETFWLDLLEQKEAQIEQISKALDSVQVENEELLSMLASKNEAATFDDTATKPIHVSMDSTNQLKRDTEFFLQEAQLPGYVTPVVEKKETAQDRALENFKSRMNYV